MKVRIKRKKSERTGRRKGWEYRISKRLRAVFGEDTVQLGSPMYDGERVPGVELPKFWCELGPESDVLGQLERALGCSDEYRWALAICQNGGTPVVAMTLDDFERLLRQWWKMREWVGSAIIRPEDHATQEKVLS